MSDEREETAVYPRFRVLATCTEQGASKYEVATAPGIPVSAAEIATHLSGMVFDFLKAPRDFGTEPVIEVDVADVDDAGEE